jgi:serine/threonine protein kinase
MLSPNTVLQNRYSITRLVAQGGMGAVYEARDQRLGTTVALKETFFSDEGLRKAFHREASILATLRHQALPKVIDHFTEGDGQFLVMEFIRGDDLSKILQMHGRPIPPKDALMWADQVLSALEYLHSQRPPVIHRDIKPQNLKLNERGEVILLDFGLAKEEALETSSVYRSVRGYTLNYAPLEQIQGTGTDPRSDLYGVAATFYHLMTGVAPPDALTRATALVEGRADPLQPASALNPQVSSAVSAVLEESLAQDRNKRPATAAIMRSALKKAASAATETVMAQPTASQRSSPVTSPPVFTQTAQPRIAEPLFPNLSQTPDYDLEFIEPQSTGGSRKWIAGLALVLVLAAAAATAFWLRNKASTDLGDLAKSNTGVVSSAGKTIPLSTREILSRGSEEDRYYSFIAEAGEIKFILDVLGSGSTVTVEALDMEKKLMLFNGSKPSFSLASSGEHEQATARLIVDSQQPVTLRLKTTYPKSLQAFRLRIDGPAKLSDPKTPNTDAAAPLAALFADRDRPLPLATSAVYGGQNSRKETYYTFSAGPGETRLTLNVIGKGVTITVDLFNDESEHLRFRSGAQKLVVSSIDLNEQASAQLFLDRQQRVLLRIQNNYPQSLQAYRLKFEGPIQFAQADETNSAAGVAEALKPLFSERDNPEPLRSREISGRALGNEKYYTVTAGPGIVRLTLEVEANGSTMGVEIFDSDAKLIRFDDNSAKLSVSSTGKKEKKSVELSIPREERVLVRLSTSYPDSLKEFRLKLDGAVKKM